MTIETKYKTGGEVWFMDGNKPLKCTVQKIYITATVYSNNNTSAYIDYEIMHPCDFGGRHFKVQQCQLFPSKQDLLNSLQPLSSNPLGLTWT